ncbi:hypothetical protein Tco_0541965, partial [Tanacetum coccineum]
NKDQLEDFEEFNGGSVTFGGSKGYISVTMIIVATSTTEAEYVAAANCCGQVL